MDFCPARSRRVFRTSVLVKRRKMRPRIAAIIAIAILIGICLLKGINSTLLASALGILGALGGIEGYQSRHPPKA